MDKLWVIAGLWLGGCGASSSAPVTIVLDDVVTQSVPASAADCPHGGTEIRSGIDVNGNGTLEQSEVQTRTFACSDEPSGAVVRLVVEPAGSHCARGGTAVESGLDGNGNGVLDDDEIAHTEYVCGVALLTKLVQEPAGARCTAGGVAVQSGRDRDGDSTLDADEIEHTEVVCGTRLPGDVVVRSGTDLGALANIEIIDGSLLIDNLAFFRIELPHLMEVRGTLSITRMTNLSVLELRALTHVGGLAIRGATMLHDLDGISALTDVAGDLAIAENTHLTRADLPVTRIGGGLLVANNRNLNGTAWSLTAGPTSVQAQGISNLTIGPAPGVEFFAVGDVSIDSFIGVYWFTADRVGSIDVHGSPIGIDIAAREIDGDVSLQAGDVVFDVILESPSPLGVRIGGSLHLSGSDFGILELPAKLAVQGDLTIDGTGLESIDPELQATAVTGALRIANNPFLKAVPPLSVGGALDVENNPLLVSLGPVTPATSGEVGGGLTIAGNASLAEAPALSAIRRIHGDATIASNPVLAAAFGAALTQVDGELRFDGDDRLADLGLAGLAQVGSLAVRQCRALTALDLPALTSASAIEIRGNAALGSVRIPVLHQADVGAFDNPVLPACQIDSLFAGLLGEHAQSGNDDAATCP